MQSLYFLRAYKLNVSGYRSHTAAAPASFVPNKLRHAKQKQREAGTIDKRRRDRGGKQSAAHNASCVFLSLAEQLSMHNLL